MSAMGSKPGRTLVALIVLALISSVALADEKTASAAPAGLDREAVEDTLSGLLATGMYDYDESDLENPTWMVWFRDRIRRLDEMWENSPLPRAGAGVYSVFGVVLAAVFLGSALAMLLSRIFGGGRPRLGIQVAGEGGNEQGVFAGWSEGGARDALDLASAGKLREASSILFGSLLGSLNDSGWIRYRKGRPSRAYLRQLRRSDLLYPLFRDFLWRFELAYYRKGEPSGDDWEFLYDSYRNLANTTRKVRPPVYMRQT